MSAKIVLEDRDVVVHIVVDSNFEDPEKSVAIIASDYFQEDIMNAGFIFIPSLLKETHFYIEDCLASCELKPKCNIVTFDKTRQMCRGYENVTQSIAFISVPGTKIWSNNRKTTLRNAYPGLTWVADPSRAGKVFSPTASREFIPHLDDCVDRCRNDPAGCHYLTFTEGQADCRSFVGTAENAVPLANTHVWMQPQLGRDLESTESFYLIVKENLNRADANAYCEQDGIFGHLLKINNVQEQAFLNANAAFDGTTTATLWMDAEANADGRFLWNVGRPEFTYLNMAYGQPADTSNKKCLTMAKADGTWSSATCSDLMHFVCEME
ncbi:uncharacterized protein LOC132559266 [Ylistrum balloti]|uniref:uncharacterized protein LOC132559266 n=1 Tax=Ylistrum balloti TaxID=509963 RepID=UPI002905F0CE|nr:uncharacterized protein LOC132559266 [Ylistrum balloti]